MVAVLFDLEGTLVQTPWEEPEHVLEFRRRTRRKLIELGIQSSVLEGTERSTVMRNKASEYTEKHFSKAEAKRFKREIEKFLKHYEMDAARNSKLFPETLSALNKLKKLGIKMGIVTNTSREAVNTVFRLHGLKRYFTVVVTREDVKELKPRSEGVLLAVKTLGAKSIFVVGDLIHDATAAKEAGVSSIIVKRKPPMKLSFHADYIVQSLNDVPTLIQVLMKNSGRWNGMKP